MIHERKKRHSLLLHQQPPQEQLEELVEVLTLFCRLCAFLVQQHEPMFPELEKQEKMEKLYAIKAKRFDKNKGIKTVIRKLPGDFQMWD